MRVIVAASVSMYEAGGSAQLYVTAVRSDGLSDLFPQLEGVKKKLAAQGLFDSRKKKPLPQYSMCIGVITVKTGTAVQDILVMISRRWPLAEVVVYSSLVQGIQASGAIIENLRKADQGGRDVILLARSGGPTEDLRCFDKEAVTRAVSAMHTVVVIDVDHETDTTLVGYVSDAQAPTPTIAAELITPNLEEVRMNVSLVRRRFVKSMETRLHMMKQTLEPICLHRYMRGPLSYIREEEMKLAMHTQRLSIVEATVAAMAMQLKQNSHKLTIHSRRLFQKNTRSIAENKLRLMQTLHNYDALQKRQIRDISALLDVCSLLKSLSRSYIIAYHGDEVISSIDAIKQNGRLRLHMQNGYLYTSIEKKGKL